LTIIYKYLSLLNKQQKMVLHTTSFDRIYMINDILKYHPTLSKNKLNNLKFDKLSTIHSMTIESDKNVKLLIKNLY